MKLKILIFSLVILIMTSCKRQHTIIEAAWSDGSPKRICVYFGSGDSRELLKETTYYMDRQKEMEGSYKDNLRDGQWTVWYKNGNKWSEGFFKKGLNDGKRTTWYETGKIRYEAWYRDGIKVGKWRFFDEKGNLQFEKTYSTP
jgi:antitoxin component YwqK of YwqJK toxin-antitoxin module